MTNAIRGSPDGEESADMTRATPIEGPKPSTHPQETSTSWRRSLRRSLDDTSAKCTHPRRLFPSEQLFNNRPSVTSRDHRSEPPACDTATVHAPPHAAPYAGLRPVESGPIAQGIEQRFPKPCVASSNLAGVAITPPRSARGARRRRTPPGTLLLVTTRATRPAPAASPAVTR